MKRIAAAFAVLVAFVLPASAAVDIQEVKSPGGITACRL